MTRTIRWPATAVRWADGIVYFGVADAAAGSLYELSKSAADASGFDDKEDSGDDDSPGTGLVSLDCGEVYLPGECAHLTLLVFPGDLPFPCEVLHPPTGLGRAREVVIELEGGPSFSPPGAYVVACGLEKAEQEDLYKALCHEVCEGWEDVYQRTINKAPKPSSTARHFDGRVRQY